MFSVSLLECRCAQGLLPALYTIEGLFFYCFIVQPQQIDTRPQGLELFYLFDEKLYDLVMKCGRHDAMLFLLYIFLFPNAQSKNRTFEKKTQMFDLFFVFYYFSPKIIVITK